MRRRTRVGKGIYRDAYGLSATVKVGATQREKRFPFDTGALELRGWQDGMRADLRREQQQLLQPAARRGTLEGDGRVYLAQVKHLASYASRACEVGAWTDLYGQLRRSQLTAEHVRKARATWVGEGYSPKTINNRVQTLRHLFHVLDGRRAPTPADDVTPLPVADSPKVLINATVFRAVAANLTDAKTKARFMVIASTGVRPAEVKRAEPMDIDLDRRVWVVRTAKGGSPRAFWLNDDMHAAIEAFIAADAWGPFDSSDYAKALYAAGWPRDVRPYQARHSVALELGERGIDIGDVQGWLGHKHVTTTRKHYAPVLVSRLKQASERLAGRFGGWVEGRGALVDVVAQTLEQRKKLAKKLAAIQASQRTTAKLLGVNETTIRRDLKKRAANAAPSSSRQEIPEQNTLPADAPAAYAAPWFQRDVDPSSGAKREATTEARLVDVVLAGSLKGVA